MMLTCVCVCNWTGRSIVSAQVGDAEDGFALNRLGYFFRCIISVSTKNGCAHLEIEPRHVKTGISHMRKQRQRSAADQRLCFRYMVSEIPLLSKSEISSL